MLAPLWNLLDLPMIHRLKRQFPGEVGLPLQDRCLQGSPLSAPFLCTPITTYPECHLTGAYTPVFVVRETPSRSRTHKNVFSSPSTHLPLCSLWGEMQTSLVAALIAQNIPSQRLPRGQWSLSPYTETSSWKSPREEMALKRLLRNSKFPQTLRKLLAKKIVLSYDIRGPPSALGEMSEWWSLFPISWGFSSEAKHPRKQNKSGQRMVEEPVMKIIKVLGTEELSYQGTWVSSKLKPKMKEEKKKPALGHCWNSCLL